jgi:hypothetical protein
MEVCTCSKTHWSSGDLFPIADLLSTLLSSHEAVTGVAVTGSVARMEPTVHDLDLVVFHDGSLATGGFRQKSDIPTEWESFDKEIGDKLARRLNMARGLVPVTYLFAKETTLWNCEDLQDFASKEKHPGFWRTIFCQTPLLLLGHDSHQLDQFTGSLEPQIRMNFEVLEIKHHCGSPGCYPLYSWERTQENIRTRKKEREQRALAGVPRDSGWDDDS